MEKYNILLSYYDKQLQLISKLLNEVREIDVSSYSEQFVFALRTQQLYTAIEDLFKQIAKAFENHIDELSSYHKELLIRLSLEIKKIRPAVISKESFLLLDKIRAFRHFVRHAYDCEFDEFQLRDLQNKLIHEFDTVSKDLERFRTYILKLSET